MLGDTRAILFQTELEWPPLDMGEFRVGPTLVRKLYNMMFEPDFSDYHYDNLDLQGKPPTLSKLSEDGRRWICQLRDKSLFIEDRWPANPQSWIDEYGRAPPQSRLDDFLRAIVAVIGAFDAVGKSAKLNLPPILVQKCRIQCLSQPLGSRGSLELLASKVASVMESITPFGRPPSYFGVRFRFPPCEIEHEDGETTEHKDFVTVRFETFSEDTSLVWMEVAAVHLSLGGPMSFSEIEPIKENVRDSYQFITEKCREFLNQFDGDNLPGDDESPQKSID